MRRNNSKFSFKTIQQVRCESCQTNEFEVEEPTGEGQQPFRLCTPCQNRLVNKALRPLEFFNLAAIHGHHYYLGDYFYDDITGVAEQPGIEILDAEKFPFPLLKDIQNNLPLLVDYACVQYFTESKIIEALKQFDKKAILQVIAQKVSYNRAINYKAYEIVARCIGPIAKDWIKNEWANKRSNEVLILAEAIVSCLEFDDAFEMLTKEIESRDEKYLRENLSALFYFEHEKTLGWIEKVIPGVQHMHNNWGILAAASQFSWQRAEKWLASGRLLSLIALDALVYCTINGWKANQALWFKNHPPQLIDRPAANIIAQTVNDYLQKDRVPRTQNAVNAILENLFGS
ncbi:MAG TPA: hypothetical protein VK174_08670 [Chitinophagales bacterium]|nr:hypothetical protein [Chitinophagales bacterium]